MTAAPLAEVHVRRSCRVVLAGWYGAVNPGDEWLLATLARWVQEAGGIPIAMSVHPSYTRATLEIEAVGFDDTEAIVAALAGADLFVLGGGGLLQDYDPLDESAISNYPAPGATRYAQLLRLADELGVRTLALAQGVGPLRSEGARSAAVRMFDRTDDVTLRDLASADLLRSLGTTRALPVAPDPVWAMPLPAPVDLAKRYPVLAGRRLLAINVRDWPYAEAWEPWLLAALPVAVPEGWACVWLDFQRTPVVDPRGFSGGERAAALVAQLPPGSAHSVIDARDATDVAAIISGCQALLAMRLHAVLVGHLAGVPVAAIEYDDKVRALNASVAMPASQRMSLAELPACLARAVATITRGPPYASVAPRAAVAELSHDALVHRTTLWRAMSAPRSRPAQCASPGSVLAGLLEQRPALGTTIIAARRAPAQIVAHISPSTCILPAS